MATYEIQSESYIGNKKAMTILMNGEVEQYLELEPAEYMSTNDEMVLAEDADKIDEHLLTMITRWEQNN